MEIEVNGIGQRLFKVLAIVARKKRKQNGSRKDDISNEFEHLTDIGCSINIRINIGVNMVFQYFK